MIGQQLLHYRIEEKIGAGGQGTVYKSLDTKLKRPVVLKILPPELTVKESAFKRFEREAQLASALDHPNICTIFDFNDLDGVRFIVMQFIQGRNVRQLVNGKPLELRSALSIAIQLSDALAAAHARGIIHRDIKASNVMVNDSGQVKVLDFGLAKLLDDADARAKDIHQTEITEVGAPYGTATAAAPEQAIGGKVNHRADIFSMGVLLYETLTGTWPFRGKSNEEVRRAVVYDEPRPLAEARGNIKDEEVSVIARLQTILNRTLAKKTDDRYQNIAELRDDLLATLREIAPDISQDPFINRSFSSVPPRHHAQGDWLAQLQRHKTAAVLGVVLLATIAAAAFFYLRRERAPAANDALAILPFMNATKDSESDYLSEGITESLINSLATLPALKVRSRSSIFRYKDQSFNLAKIGQELGVTTVLTGSVERRGENLSVNVELIDTRDDSHIWGERYTRKLANLTALQEELARDVAENLCLRLTGAEIRQLVKNYATNAEAYQLYLQGRYQWNRRTPDGLRQGIEYFKRALEKDANYAPAHSGLADCYFLLNVYNIAPATETDPQAREAAQRALKLDESLAEAHASLGSVSYRFDWNFAAAETEFKRAIELRPDYATAHQWYSALLAATGRFDESVAQAKRARELEPFSPTINSDLGRHLYYARRYDEAAAAHRDTLAKDKNYARAHYELGYALVQLRRYDEAVTECEQATMLDKDSLNAQIALGYAYAVAGRKADALKVIEHLKQTAQTKYVSPYHFAVTYIGLGDREAALKHLAAAADERFNWLVFIGVEPLFDPLRDDARFKELTERMGLKQ